MVDADSRIIVALDVDAARRAWELVDQFGDGVVHYKIGLQLLIAAGPSLVRELVARGKRVFLDTKLHEIPHAAAGAVAAAGELGVSIVTVHASAGPAVVRAAVQAAAPWPTLQVLALTVITSLRDADLAAIGVPGTVAAQVERLAQLAADAGCHGVVASAHEATRLRELLAPGSSIVVPGVQLVPDSASDQTRLSSPQAALAAGATHLVVGRAITQACDPVAALARLRQQMPAG